MYDHIQMSKLREAEILSVPSQCHKGDKILAFGSNVISEIVVFYCCQISIAIQLFAVIQKLFSTAFSSHLVLC